jgi:hypothetical protein
MVIIERSRFIDPTRIVLSRRPAIHFGPIRGVAARRMIAPR